MTDLTVCIGGMELDNPIMVGSATPTWDGAHCRKGYLKGAGAVVPKTVSPDDHPFRHPENGRFKVFKKGNRPYGMVNVEIFSTLPESAWVTRELKEAKRDGAKLIVSTLAMEKPDETAALIRRIAATGLADAIELNNSCPMHVSMTDANIVPLTTEQTTAAREATELPLLVKFPSTVSSLVDATKAAEACGADGVVISNSMRGFAGVNLETGRPLLGTIGGYSGDAIKPLIQSMVIDVARAISIPIVAVGGISSWQDVAEYIMLGATAVQVVSGVMWQGFDVIESMKKGLSEFMCGKGYRSLQDFRGLALPYIGDYDSILDQPPLRSVIDPNRCTACGHCETVCFYEAVKRVGSGYAVDPTRCDGCGLCAELCPVEAIELKAMDDAQ